MIGLDETPVLQVEEASIMGVLRTIEQYGLGLAIIVDSRGKLVGISTNADIRRTLLRSAQDLQQVAPELLINHSPLVAYADNTVTDLLRTVKRTNFPVSYLPVTDRLGTVVGTITFTNLVKGEM